MHSFHAEAQASWNLQVWYQIAGYPTRTGSCTVSLPARLLSTAGWDPVPASVTPVKPVHRGYSHLEMQVLRLAVSKLPGLSPQAGPKESEDSRGLMEGS